MNYDINEVFKICINNLKLIGIDLTGNDMSFEWSHRMTKACGRTTHYRATDRYKITINADYASRVNINELLDTIYHELLHTAPNCMNHGKEWQRLAEKCNKAYHTNVSTYYTGDEYDPNKYAVKCTDCGAILNRRTRKTSIWNYVKNGNGNGTGYGCPYCKTKNLVAIYL